MFKIKINPLWIVLLFTMSYFGYMQSIVLYFIYLLLHEMGHMYMARVLGYKFDDIDELLELNEHQSYYIFKKVIKKLKEVI